MFLILNKLRLKWKVFAYLLGFCALLLIILWLFQTVFLNAFYLKIKVHEVKSNASSIAENIEHEELSELVDTISYNSDMFVHIMTSDGENIYFSGNEQEHLPENQVLDLIEKARENNGEYYEYTSEERPKMQVYNTEDIVGDKNRLPPYVRQSLTYVKLVEGTSDGTTVILINSLISPVNATVTTLRYQLYFITAIIIILAVFLAFLISKRVSAPIEEINKSAKNLSNGSYDTSFSGKGYLEISELADTLNTASEELSKVETLRRELIANISHDLRTPLSLIYSYAEMMHDFPSEISAEQVQVIMDETQRLATLVNDVLDISKFETGSQSLNITKFNLTASLKSTADRISELIKNDGYMILFSYKKEVFINADEVKITQVFYNLLVNAINYTGTDKTIKIIQSVHDDKVRLEVVDSGEGISTDNIPYIWDRYYKVDKKHKRNITGTGLGLSIVKKAVELHGGECGVSSDVGKGSTFWFELKMY